MEGEDDVYDQSFIEAPAILDKHKAAAVVAEGKFYTLTYVIGFHFS